MLIAKLNKLMDKHFPFKKVSFKNTDNPWITPKIKARIKARKRTYDKEHR